MVYSKCCNCRVIVWLAVYTSSQASRYCVFSMLVLQKRWEAWCYSEKWRRLGIGRSGLGPDSMTNHVTQGESLQLSGRQSSHYCPRGPDRRPVKCLALIFSDPTCRLSDLPFFPVLCTAAFCLWSWSQFLYESFMAYNHSWTFFLLVGQVPGVTYYSSSLLQVM